MSSDPLISKHSLHIIFLFRSFHMYGHLHACRDYAVTKFHKTHDNVNMQLLRSVKYKIMYKLAVVLHAVVFLL